MLASTRSATMATSCSRRICSASLARAPVAAGARRRLAARALDEQQEAQARAPSDAGARLAAAAAATALLLSGSVMAAPQPVYAAATLDPVSQVQALEDEMRNRASMLEFIVQQQENASKAAIQSQRQMLQVEVKRLEAELQARLNQQRANVLGASKAGDAKAEESARLAASDLEEKQARVIKAAAQLSSRLDRLELVERARSAAARQTIRKATSDLAAEGGGGGNPALNGAAGKLNPWVEVLGLRGFGR